MAGLRRAEVIGFPGGNYLLKHDRDARHAVLGREMSQAQLRQQLEVADGCAVVGPFNAHRETGLKSHREIVDQAILVIAA